MGEYRSFDAGRSNESDERCISPLLTKTHRGVERKAHIWVGKARFVIVICMVGIAAVQWIWTGDRQNSTVTLAAIGIFYSGGGLIALQRIDASRQNRLSWAFLFVDSMLITLLGLLEAATFEQWTVLWVMLTALTVPILRRSAGYVISALGAISLVIVHHAHWTSPVDPKRWLGDLLLIPAVLLVSHVLSNFVTEERSVQSNLHNLAIRDGLTGLYNRRYFSEILDSKMARAAQEKQPLSLLLIDIDHFKPLNDRYGHIAGDQILETLANLLAASVRAADMVFRYGGEEFAILLPNANTTEVQQVASRVLSSIRSHEFVYEPVTVSMGWATYIPGENEMDGTTLVQTADASLYRAKGEGRDRIVGM